MMRHFDGMEEGGRGRDRSVAGPFAQMATDAKQTSRGSASYGTQKHKRLPSNVRVCQY